jgi:hypothetical protein
MLLRTFFVVCAENYTTCVHSFVKIQALVLLKQVVRIVATLFGIITASFRSLVVGTIVIILLPH